MFKRLICFIIILILVGCEPVLLPAPTPTQEAGYSTPIPHYTGDCLPDGVLPINPNPCPTDGLGYDMEFVSRPSVNYESYNAVLDCDERCVIGLHDPAQQAGFAAIQIHNLSLNAGQLYIANLDGVMNIQDAAEGDYAGAAVIHTDTGNSYLLRQHGLERYEGGKWTRNGTRNFFWCFRPMADSTVVFEAGILAQWATYHTGNNYVVEGVYVYPTNDVNLCGETVVIQ